MEGGGELIVSIGGVVEGMEGVLRLSFPIVYYPDHLVSTWSARAS